MPIEQSVPIKAISQQEFYEIDERMLGHAFDIHNQFGCLMDEAIYKKELAARCSKEGMPVQREATKITRPARTTP